MLLFGGTGYQGNDVYGYLNDLWRYDPDSDLWTWVSGSQWAGQFGVYGTKGVAAAANIPGGRDRSVSWIDSAGNLWLFGGYGVEGSPVLELGHLNDLWRYNPVTKRWTWMSGSDTSEQAGVYGTKGVAAAANVPGARMTAFPGQTAQVTCGCSGATAIQSRHSGHLNDLWRYDPATNRWTWMSGSNTAAQSGIYGTKGVAAAANVPGARQSSISWTDSAGDLWLFGGVGYDSAAILAYLNDLWRYDPDTNQWTWMSGSKTRDQAASTV